MWLVHIPDKFTRIWLLSSIMLIKGNYKWNKNYIVNTVQRAYRMHTNKRVLNLLLFLWISFFIPILMPYCMRKKLYLKWVVIITCILILIDFRFSCFSLIISVFVFLLALFQIPANGRRSMSSIGSTGQAKNSHWSQWIWSLLLKWKDVIWLN